MELRRSCIAEWVPRKGKRSGWRQVIRSCDEIRKFADITCNQLAQDKVNLRSLEKPFWRARLDIKWNNDDDGDIMTTYPWLWTAFLTEFCIYRADVFQDSLFQVWFLRSSLKKSARKQKAYRAPSLNTEMERIIRTKFFVSPSFMKFSAAWHQIHEFCNQLRSSSTYSGSAADYGARLGGKKLKKKKAWPWIVVHKGKMIWSERQQLRGRLQR